MLGEKKKKGGAQKVWEKKGKQLLKNTNKQQLLVNNNANSSTGMKKSEACVLARDRLCFMSQRQTRFIFVVIHLATTFLFYICLLVKF